MGFLCFPGVGSVASWEVCTSFQVRFTRGVLVLNMNLNVGNETSLVELWRLKATASHGWQRIICRIVDLSSKLSSDAKSPKPVTMILGLTWSAPPWTSNHHFPFSSGNQIQECVRYQKEIPLIENFPSTCNNIVVLPDELETSPNIEAYRMLTGLKFLNLDKI